MKLKLEEIVQTMGQITDNDLQHRVNELLSMRDLQGFRV